MSNGLPALIRIGLKEKANSLIGAHPSFKDLTLSPSGYGVRLKAGALTRLGGKAKDGDDTAEDSLVGANQRVLIALPTALLPNKYNFFVSSNPDLLAYGIVSMNAFVTKSELPGLTLQFSAFKQVDLNIFPWVFQIAIID